MTALALLDHVPAWHANKLSIRALFVFCLVSGTVHTGIPDSSRLACMLMVATLLVQNTKDNAPDDIGSLCRDRAADCRDGVGAGACGGLGPGMGGDGDRVALGRGHQERCVGRSGAGRRDYPGGDHPGGERDGGDGDQHAVGGAGAGGPARS